MKKYRICLFLFLVISGICIGAGVAARMHYERTQAQPSLEETLTEPPTIFEEENVRAANQEQVAHESQTALKEEYYLVAEDGFLLVFLKDKKTINLYTHVPLMDFPISEQEKLREGIWFSSMMEVFQYLESYTS